jgi:hypothetical protein
MKAFQISGLEMSPCPVPCPVEKVVGVVGVIEELKGVLTVTMSSLSM